MKLFRFGVLVMALSLMLATNASAQGKGKGKGKTETHGQGQAHGEHEQKSPEEKAKARTNWMKNKLGIDATQEQSVYNIYLTSFQKIDEIRKSVQGPDKRTQVQNERTNMENQLKGALTAEQYAAYLKIKEEKKAKGEKDDDNDGDDKGQNVPNTPRTPKTQTPPKSGATKG